MDRGRFITIEGIEGAGKTTVMDFVFDYLSAHQIPLIQTREPGGTPIAEAIRQILLTQSSEENLTAESELLLMFAARSQHISSIIQPALQTGKWVLSDRFVDASYAYQGGGRQLSSKYIAWLDQWIVNNIQPDLTFLLDLPPEVGFMRIQHRKHDRIEQEKHLFFSRVREQYLARAKKFPDRIKIIDASCSIEKVIKSIENYLITFLES